MVKLCLKSIADDRVLERVEALAGRVNEVTAELLAYLGELDTRRLHLGQACSSLFAFCVERLHMSESAAGKRVTAARVARRFPVVLAPGGEGSAGGRGRGQALPSERIMTNVEGQDGCRKASARGNGG